jgi:hypothetical protein
MANFPRLFIVFMLLVFLIACSARNTTNKPTPPSTQFSQPATLAKTLTDSPMRTQPSSLIPLPSATADQTQNARSHAMEATQSSMLTLIPLFPHVCTENLMPVEISPNSLWMAEECFVQSIQSPILTI